VDVARIRNFLFIILLVNVFSLSGIKVGLSANYGLKIAIDKERNEASAEEIVRFINKEREEIGEIYFHLYPQGFKGKIRVKEVKSEGRSLNYRVEKNILKVVLPEKLLSGKEIVLSLKFELKLPEGEFRFGYYKELISLMNWYPILAVYEGGKWSLGLYQGVDDPFYSEISSYEVEVILPAEEVIASTGELVKEVAKEEKKHLYLKADKVRDFALVISPKYKLIEQEVKKIEAVEEENKEKAEEAKGTSEKNEEEVKLPEINVYYFKGKSIGEVILSMAEGAVTYFNSILGIYPYKKLKLAQVYGEEVFAYPELIVIGDRLWSSKGLSSYRLEYRVAYGIARQWWSQIVGANGAKEPFLMEALANYSALMYMEKKFGKERAKSLFFSLHEVPYSEYLQKGGKNLAVLSSLKSFNLTSYEAIVKGKGTIILSMLRYLVGDEVFSKIFQSLFSQYKYSQVTTQNFIEVASQISGKNLEWFFEEWLNSTREIDYEVSEVISQKETSPEGKEGYRTLITLTQKGNAVMPAEVLIELGNGERIIKKWEKEERVKKYSLFTEEGVSFVEVDPEQKILEKVRENNIRVSRSYTRKKFLHFTLGLFLWDIFSCLMIGIVIVILSLFFSRWDRFRERKPLVSLVVIFVSLFACKIVIPYLFLGLPSAGISEAILEAASSLPFLYLIISFLVATFLSILALKMEKLDLAQGKVLIQAFIFWVIIDVLVSVFPYLFII